MERVFRIGTSLYSASLRQDVALGIYWLEDQRLTVAWLTPKSAANWHGKRLWRRITSFKNETSRVSPTVASWQSHKGLSMLDKSCSCKNDFAASSRGGQSNMVEDIRNGCQAIDK